MREVTYYYTDDCGLDLLMKKVRDPEKGIFSGFIWKVDEKVWNEKWELTRFASDNGKICQGIGGKLFKHFIREYNPSEIKSFADRRWTINEESNVYIKLGFKFDGYLAPQYRYYNAKVDRYHRFHKFGFRKQILSKKYGFPLTMTETEMTEKLGYKKIWDCGLIKYVWTNEGT